MVNKKYGHFLKMHQLKYYNNNLLSIHLFIKNKDLYDFVLYSLDDGVIFKYLLSTSYPSVALNNVNLSLA